MGTDEGEKKAEVAVAALKDVKDAKEEKEKVEQETPPDTDNADSKKQEDTKMPPPAPSGAGSAGAGGARGAAGNSSGSAAIQAAVKAGNINIHQEERESRALSLLVCSFCLSCALYMYTSRKEGSSGDSSVPCRSGGSRQLKQQSNA